MAVAVAAGAAAVIGPVSSTSASPRATAAGIGAPAAARSPPPQPAGRPCRTSARSYRYRDRGWSRVRSGSSAGFGQASGMIFVGVKPGFPTGSGCGLAASLAWILPAGQVPKGIRHRRPTAVIHGIPLYRLPSGKGSVLYLVPELGVRVGARGRLAPRVLATLARSPLSVVLRRGPATPVPPAGPGGNSAASAFATPLLEPAARKSVGHLRDRAACRARCCWSTRPGRRSTCRARIDSRRHR